jgi:pre-rRNA-processing protein TSR3
MGRDLVCPPPCVERRLSKFTWGHSFYKLNAEFIEKYRTCKTSEDVIQMQERIQDEMEQARLRRRKEMDEWGDGDLLRENPNHRIVESSEEEDESHDQGDGKDAVETVTARFAEVGVT